MTSNQAIKVEQPAMFRVPAISGVQQYRLFYTLMLNLHEVGKRCVSKDELNKNEPVPPEYRTQRNISSLRVNKLFEYLLHAALSKQEFVLPALTCLIDRLEFVGTGSVGELVVADTLPWYLADGQHMAKAIRKLRKVFYTGLLGKRRLTKTEKYNLEWMLAQHVPVTVFHEAGFNRAQQMFADINSHVCKPDKQLLELFDHRKRREQNNAQD